jgi:hypothetical protein
LPYSERSDNLDFPYALSLLQRNPFDVPFLLKFPSTSTLFQVLDNHSWLEEKNQLVQAHNDAKVKLITEIQTLRKMLTPTAEQHFNELRGSEFLRVALEEEVINTHIQNDNLKVKS